MKIKQMYFRQISYEMPDGEQIRPCVSDDFVLLDKYYAEYPGQ